MFDVIISGGTVVDGSGRRGFRADVGINDERSLWSETSPAARRGASSTPSTDCGAGVYRYPRPLRWRAVGGSTACEWAAPRNHDGDPGTGRVELRPDVAGELSDVSSVSVRDTGRAARGSRHVERGGVQVALRPQGLDQHRLQRRPWRDPVGDGGVPGRPSSRRRSRSLRSTWSGRAWRMGSRVCDRMSYHPNAWSDTDELVAICEVVAEYGGVYTTHLRDVNTDRGFGGGGVPEALEIGRRAGIKVHFSHYDPGVQRGQVAEQLELIDRAKAEGVDCTLEVVPLPHRQFLPAELPPERSPRRRPGRDHGAAPRQAQTQPADPGAGGQPAPLTARRCVHIHEGQQGPRGNELPDVAAMRGKRQSRWDADRSAGGGGRTDLLQGAPPDSVRVWDQISRDAMEFLSRPTTWSEATRYP